MTDLEMSVLRSRAERGDSDAADQLIESAAEQGDLATLERLASQGNATAADQLIESAAEQGDLATLERLAQQGNATAADQLSNQRPSRAVSPPSSDSPRGKRPSIE